jgi:RND family efflux transporter MFP subunit
MALLIVKTKTNPPFPTLIPNIMKNILSVVLAVVLFAACGPKENDKAAQLQALKDQRAQIDAQIAALEKEVGPQEGAEKRIKTVTLQELQPTVFQHFIDLQGKVEAEESVPATAKMPGMLTRVYVKNGDQVKKGQLLAQVDDELIRRALLELDVQLKTAQDLYNRQKGLWDQKIGTEVQYIQAKTNLESIEQRIATTNEQLAQSKIYAPISGTVDLVILKAGQSIAPGMPLCNIINFGDLKVKGAVTEAYAAKVRNGDMVNVYFPDLKKEIQSRVTYVSKSIDPMTRTFVVECRLPANPEYRANMIAVMKITDYTNPKAIVVPVNVIQNGEEGEFVLAADKTGANQATAKKVMVKQGTNYNGMVEISNGLKAGDWIISTGYQNVNNGETVAF